MKVPKGELYNNYMDEPFLAPRKTFSDQFLNDLLLCFTLNTLKCPWMLNVPRGTIDANEELYFQEWTFHTTDVLQITLALWPGVHRVLQKT